MIYGIIILSIALPICTITAFVIGYNIKADKKILVPKKKHKQTEDEKKLDYIDNFKG